MKSNCEFFFWIVLIYCAICEGVPTTEIDEDLLEKCGMTIGNCMGSDTPCCFDVTAEYEKMRSDNACILKYLKTKGSLADDFPLNEQPSTCGDTTVEMPKVYDRMLEDLKHLMDKKMPNEANTSCVMTEFTTRGKTQDRLLAVATINRADSLVETEKETHLISLMNALKQDLTDIFAKCGVKEDIMYILGN